MAASELVSQPSTPIMGPCIGDYRAPVADRPLRVVYVWDADYPWDVRAEKICATLTSAGHDVHLVARNRGWLPTQERLPEAMVHRMSPWRVLGRRVDGALGFPAFFSPRWSALLNGTVRSVRPDVIVARDIPLAPTTIWVARRHGVPVVLDVAENYPAMMRMIYEAGRHRLVDHVVRNPAAAAAVERYSLFRASRIIVVVEEMAERMRRMGVSASRIDVITNTPPRSRAEPTPRRNARGEGEPLELVYLGLLEIPRGLVELLDAVALLRDDAFPVRLTVVGTGRDAELLQELAHRLRLGPAHVRFLGYVDRETALAAVEHADIGVLPHHRNEQWNTSMPNKLFDYMAVALPVVTSDAVPCVRITRESGAGEVFEAGNVASLAAAIRRLGSAEARARCGAAGRRAVLERYNWECEVPILLQSIARAAEGTTAGR